MVYVDIRLHLIFRHLTRTSWISIFMDKVERRLLFPFLNFVQSELKQYFYGVDVGGLF